MERIPVGTAVRRFREGVDMSVRDFSRVLGIGDVLLLNIEAGGVTHPNIVRRIQEICGLTDEQAEELLPVNRRPHDERYDPDRYVDYYDLYGNPREGKRDEAQRWLYSESGDLQEACGREDNL